jgi:tRNA (guanine-N7-)-methyltransferase
MTEHKEHTILLSSYGRTRGRKLRPHRESLVETLLPKLLIDLQQEQLDLTSLFSVPDNPLWFEIGFGAGEHLAEQARLHPGINFIGCEPFINGVATLLAAVEKHQLKNIRLYAGDARLVLQRLADASIERLFVLFADPWPKTRHHKRRIISQVSLALFYLKLKPNGLLRLATDHLDYRVWMLEQLLSFGKLQWAAQSKKDWEIPPSDWIRTRYQAKAEAAGRSAVFLDFIK